MTASGARQHLQAPAPRPRGRGIGPRGLGRPGPAPARYSSPRWRGGAQAPSRPSRSAGYLDDDPRSPALRPRRDARIANAERRLSGLRPSRQCLELAAILDETATSPAWHARPGRFRSTSTTAPRRSPGATARLHERAGLRPARGAGGRGRCAHYERHDRSCGYEITSSRPTEVGRCARGETSIDSSIPAARQFEWDTVLPFDAWAIAGVLQSAPWPESAWSVKK